MSGQLVGQVIDAMAPGGKLETLSYPERLALIAIAEKCLHESRQGCVPISHIQHALGKSRSTADRTVRKLRTAGYVWVVKRGYKAHGKTRAPIYELADIAPLPIPHRLRRTR